MKIAFVLKSYPRISETFIAQEIHLLEERGFEIEIYSLQHANEPQRQPINEKIRARVTYIPDSFALMLAPVFKENFRTFCRFPWRWIKGFFGALGTSVRRRNKNPIQIFLQAGWLVGKKELGRPNHPVAHLHAHFTHTPTEFAWAVSRLTGLKFSISAHAKDLSVTSSRDLLERIRASELIMTCSPSNHEFLAQLPDVPKEKIHRVDHGINLEIFKPAEHLQLSEGTLRRFVTVGRLTSRKGHEDILRALSLLRTRGHDFLYEIYGTGDQEEVLRARVREWALEDRVSFYNAATHPQIIERFREGGLFLLASHWLDQNERSGIPNTLAEAMAMKLPVIATEGPGISELVQNEESGLLVPEKRPDLLAAAIERILMDPSLATRLGENARRRIEKNFNAKTWIEHCDRLLRPLIATPTKSSKTHS